jgi:cell division FtsZ-interacting protein ZapD
MTLLTTLPDDIISALSWLGNTAISAHATPAQLTAAHAVGYALRDDDAAALVETLHELARAYTRNVRGHIIPRTHNWLHRNASAVAQDIEAWTREQRIAA